MTLARAAPPCGKYTRAKLRPNGPQAFRTSGTFKWPAQLDAIRLQDSHLLFVRCIHLLWVCSSLVVRCRWSSLQTAWRSWSLGKAQKIHQVFSQPDVSRVPTGLGSGRQRLRELCAVSSKRKIFVSSGYGFSSIPYGVLTFQLRLYGLICMESNPNQPYCLQALQTLSSLCHERDVTLWSCLLRGVPTGIDGDIPLSNVLVAQCGDHPFERNLSICRGNWTSAEADASTLHRLVEDERESSWLAQGI